MLLRRLFCSITLGAYAAGFGFYPHFPFGPDKNSSDPVKDAFLDELVNNMTIPELCAS
jgi:hypothetical protein